jgi:SEC-C motif-containing protein
MAESKADTLPGDGPCPCGSGRTLAACCGPILAGHRVAETAEDLMRARFAAHVGHDFAFLHRSYRPTARLPYVPEPEEGKRVQWTRLVIHASAPGRTPDFATVDFSAHGRQDGAEVVLHENAEFQREDGAWTYTRSLREGPAPVRHAGPKPGRNDPCPCGSGKKYKQCCLGKA